ncbi:MAG: hypothetical protein FJ284_12035 [Planctomycetes bacterium]|nr:hypothetical protein [Planctomycetota bacterium]
MLEGEVGRIAGMVELLPTPLDFARRGRRSGSPALVSWSTRVTAVPDRGLRRGGGTRLLRLAVL